MVDIIVRCPYCVRLNEFMPMDAKRDGRCVCPNCGHVVIPGSKTLRCSCDHCKAMEAFVRDGRAWWLASA
jgi:hypothetical protein